MTLVPAATAASVALHELDEHLDGEVPVSLARRLEIARVHLQEFVDGDDVTPHVAAALGVPLETLDELAERLGRGGRIGFLLGRVWTRSARG